MTRAERILVPVEGAGLLEAPGYLALCVDPATRHQGVGQAMLAALSRRPELAAVRRLAAGVEPANQTCVGCLHAAGFRPYTTEPDFEGMLYYLHDR